MEAEASGENLGAQVESSGHVSWTSSMSSYMLSNLATIVANGTRTSSGFKKVHCNACARDLNDHFKVRLTGDQISNHVRTWKRKYGKILKLKMILSGALWDEDNGIIRLDHEHYTGHIKQHKADAEYLNKPIENYHEMATIFGNSLATGKYAKGSNEPLATEATELDGDEDGGRDGAATNIDVTQSANGAESSATKPKRAKTCTTEEVGLQATLATVGERLAIAIETAGAKAAPDNELPPDLYETLQTIPGFDETHLSHYYAHLVENPRSARAFMKMPLSGKLTWVARYVSKEFPE